MVRSTYYTYCLLPFVDFQDDEEDSYEEFIDAHIDEDGDADCHGYKRDDFIVGDNEGLTQDEDSDEKSVVKKVCLISPTILQCHKRN